jgi:pimeloyl-ACP methyl ester carboxylesterase
MIDFRKVFIATLCTIWSAGLVCEGDAQSQTLAVNPADGTVNQPFDVRIQDLPPGGSVRIDVERKDRGGVIWKSSASYLADSSRSVDVAQSPSIGGTYQGISPHGLFCSVLPVHADKLPGNLANIPNRPDQPTTIIPPLEPSPIIIRAYADDREIGSSTIKRGFEVGTSARKVAEGNWRGVFYAAAEGQPVGAPVIVISGSGGGVFSSTAALLASNGHPTLALAIYNYEDLPKALSNFPLELVRDGANWLANTSNASRVAILGISRGSEAAQLAAAYFPDIVSGVIAQVPSHLVGGALGPGTSPQDPAWTIDGKEIRPFAGPSLDVSRMAELAKVPPGYRGTLDLLATWNDTSIDPTFGIPYERIKSPMLVLAAGSDDVWPSYISADRIRTRFSDLGKAQQVRILTYADAGHGMVYVGRGNLLSHFGYNAALNGYMSSGGTAIGNCEASFDAFAQVLDFLRNLQFAQESKK